jgi:NADH:ubiquinone oxidoreductase subunit K
MGLLMVGSLVSLPQIWNASGQTIGLIAIACWAASTLTALGLVIFIRRTLRKNGIPYPPPSPFDRGAGDTRR